MERRRDSDERKVCSGFEVSAQLSGFFVSFSLARGIHLSWNQRHWMLTIDIIACAVYDNVSDNDFIYTQMVVRLYTTIEQCNLPSIAQSMLWLVI